MQDAINLVSNVGFPIAVSIIIGYACYKLAGVYLSDVNKREERFLQTINDFSTTIEKLSNTLTSIDTRLTCIENNLKEKEN